jgi:hypothetical protein
MRQKRKATKKGHSGLYGLIILVVAFAWLAFLVTSPSSSHPTIQSTRTTSQSAQGQDVFYGSIADLPLGHKDQLQGTVKADTNCKPVKNGLTNCIGIITAADGTELHFNYTHDMSTQECLSPGDRVTIIVLSDRTVKVIRG